MKRSGDIGISDGHDIIRSVGFPWNFFPDYILVPTFLVIRNLEVVLIVQVKKIYYILKEGDKSSTLITTILF